MRVGARRLRREPAPTGTDPAATAAGRGRPGEIAVNAAPRFHVREIALYERDVRLRLPFRFGVVTLRRAPQCFVRARIEYPDGRSQWGAAAELLVPKWFDKNPARSDEDNFEELRLALRLAAGAYTAGGAATAFGHFAAHHEGQIGAAAQHGLNRLTANFGAAQIDRAVLDALCRLEGCSFYAAMGANLAGIDPGLLPGHLGDLDGFAVSPFLQRLAGRADGTGSIAVRHTVGLLDAVAGHPGTVNDGLPESLEEVVAACGLSHFKLKVGGDAAADVARLSEIAAVLDGIDAPIVVSLDGNEQYDDVGAFLELWQRMNRAPALRRLVSSIAFIEQPVTRARALDADVSALSRLKPVIIDESDDDLSAFPRARLLGYAGVSSKCCKGFYKSVLNAARCAKWNSDNPAGGYFMSGEDLTTQAGLAVQQDLALVNLIGLGHVERNGHHYVNGMAGAPEREQAAFLAAHPDLYECSHGVVRVRISRGRLAIGSLAVAGFASGAEPDWDRLTPLRGPGGQPPPS